MLVRIKASGICQSRKMMWLGKGHHFGGEPLIFPMRPSDPGHEFAAVFEEIGKNVDLPFGLGASLLVSSKKSPREEIASMIHNRLNQTLQNFIMMQLH